MILEGLKWGIFLRFGSSEMLSCVAGIAVTSQAPFETSANLN